MSGLEAVISVLFGFAFPALPFYSLAPYVSHLASTFVEAGVH